MNTNSFRFLLYKFFVTVLLLAEFKFFLLPSGFSASSFIKYILIYQFLESMGFLFDVQNA